MVLTTMSRMSLTRPAGRTSNKLSMLKSPISGKSIKSLVLAKKPAAMMPNRLPQKEDGSSLALYVSSAAHE